MMERYKKFIRSKWFVSLFYSCVALLIIWPLLGPGFILTLDMVFTPNIAMPETVTSSFVFRAGLHILNLVVPSDVIEKLILFTILVLSGLGLHRLVLFYEYNKASSPFAKYGAYAAGLLYMINPFTYDRFMAGQYSVLLGYALLPFVVLALLRMFKDPSRRTALTLALLTVITSIVSIHTLGIIVIVVLVGLIQSLWANRKKPSQLKKLIGYSALASLTFMVASCYWLAPLALGNGDTASSIATFRETDQTEFATEGEGIDGKLIHALRLQGFWGERNDLFRLPQDELKVWGLFVTFLWILVGIGAVTSWRHNRRLSVLFITSAGIAALLAAGVGTSWLVSHVPFFAGYREPQKFVALIALSYALFIGLAVPRLLAKIRIPIGQIAFAATYVGLIIGLTPVMFSGFAGQLTPKQYPSDWSAVNERLSKDSDDFQVLILPWHLYMYYDFAGRLIASPGDGFFDKPVLVSDDPELGTIQPAVANSQKQLLTNHILPLAARTTRLGQQLAPLGIKYVLLTKDDDYQTYSYLNHQVDIQLVAESETLKLYRNTAFEEGIK